jgi:IS1 family transposase
VTYQDEHFRNLPCERIQADEIWSFVYSKAKNVPEEKRGQFGYGDVWTWTAIDADSKLVPSWYLGSRSAQAAETFMRDLASRQANRIQLSTDGIHVYITQLTRRLMVRSTTR